MDLSAITGTIVKVTYFYSIQRKSSVRKLHLRASDFQVLDLARMNLHQMVAPVMLPGDMPHQMHWGFDIVMSLCQDAEPCITTATWWCCKKCSKLESSFHWKLRCHLLKGLRQRQIAVVIHGTGCSSTAAFLDIEYKFQFCLHLPFHAL